MNANVRNQRRTHVVSIESLSKFIIYFLEPGERKAYIIPHLKCDEALAVLVFFYLNPVFLKALSKQIKAVCTNSVFQGGDPLLIYFGRCMFGLIETVATLLSIWDRYNSSVLLLALIDLIIYNYIIYNIILCLHDLVFYLYMNTFTRTYRERETSGLKDLLYFYFIWV